MVSDTLIAFGERLSKARFDLSLTRPELSKKIGSIPMPTIQNWENGTILPKEEMLETLALGYNVPLEELKVMWKRAKDAQKTLRAARYPSQTPKKNEGDLFSGAISNKRALGGVRTQGNHARLR